MGKKDSGGAAKAQAKAAKRAKQEAKASKTADKLAQKAKARAAPPAATPAKGGKSGKGGKGKKAPAADEEDLDALLASFREQWAAEHAVHEERIGTAPSRRANATLTPCPGGDDLWLFGGEYFDGDRATFFADLFRYTPASSSAEQGVWRSYSSANQPGPRSAHAIAPFPGNGGQLFLFGGEFASPKMNSFHHYRDLWIFTIATKSWERIDTKVRPSARSGHRMVCWKQYIVLFGGFQDTGQRTTYLGDLWLFDTTEYKWHEVKQNELRKPAARSGFSLLPSADGVILHGGYCKRYVKGQRTQGVALEDTWMLTIDAGPDGELFKTGKIEWQRRRKIGYAPGPRSGCTMALWGTKGMGALFGGVTDTEADEESMESICHADMFAYQLGGNGRWISLNLKRPKKKGGRRRKKVVAQPEQRKGPQSDDEDEEGSDRESGDEDADRSRPDAQPAPAPTPAPAPEEDDDPDDPQKSVPIGRYNTMLAIQRNILYLYGGIHETAAREYTMDDFYTLDLLKLERFHCLKDCPTDALEWNESDESDDDSDDDDSDGSSSEDDEPAEQEGEEMREADLLEELEWLGDEGMSDEAIAAAKQALLEKEELRKKAKVFMGVALDSTRSEADMLSTPLPGETLRVFYERSKAYWVGAAHEQGDQSNRGKELRRDGFAMAEKRYDEYKPMLQEIERIQAEAGLDAEDMRAAAGKTGGIAGGGAGADSRNRR